VTPPTEGPALVAHHQESSLKLVGNITTDLDFSSELFLKSGDDVIILNEGSFLDGLEEFEKHSLTEQRIEIGEALAMVYRLQLWSLCVSLFVIELFFCKLYRLPMDSWVPSDLP